MREREREQEGEASKRIRELCTILFQHAIALCCSSLRMKTGAGPGIYVRCPSCIGEGNNASVKKSEKSAE